MRQESLIDSNVFFEEPSISTLLQEIHDKENRIWSTGLKGSSKAFLTYLLREKLQRTLVIITSSMADTQIFNNNLQFFFENDSNRANERHPECLVYPPRDTLPFDTFLHSLDVHFARRRVLYSLLKGFMPVVVTTPSALMQKVMPKEVLENASENISVGLQIDRDRLIGKMVEGGYTHTDIVEEKGDFSIRGGVLDFFPPLFANPIRVEFFGDEIESIREFDRTSQRSLHALTKVVLLPVTEVIHNRETTDYAIKKITDRADEKNIPRSIRDEIIDEIKNFPMFSGIDLFLPFFYAQLDTFFDYLPKDTIILIDEKLEMESEAHNYENEMNESYRKANGKKGSLHRVEEMYLTVDEANSKRDEFQTVYLEKSALEQPFETHINFHTEGNDDVRKESMPLKSREGILSDFVEKAKMWLDDGYTLVLICHTNTQVERLLQLLDDYKLPVGIESSIHLQSKKEENQIPGSIPMIHIKVGGLLSGFRWPHVKFILITEEEIFGKRKRRQHQMRPKENYGISTFLDLKTNDYIVHIDHGVGLYRGLQKLKIDGTENDYLFLEYLDGDKLYLPVTRLHLLQKYLGMKDHSPKLDKLGGQSWESKKKKVKESIKEMAQELLKLYAVRNVQKGFSFSEKDHYYREFEATFQYEETSDQVDAIESTLMDMQDARPMDRLVCGDVGFGKTEVAIRASFKAVMDGKQVAILVPTTVLAFQHYQTLLERFKPYPVFIDMLSRFKTREEQKTILGKLKDGEIDIVVGTHRLLQKDVAFRDLGLLVIDEEHRFGVTHKEKLKQLRKTVDVIAMTATPIPRTLYLSMTGLRDLSVINTPPEDRLAIKTYITQFDDSIIRRAILKEIEREGQIFFVHNRVKSIPAMARYLKRLTPEARIGIAHGQMTEKELERVILSFMKKETDLLLCTTIIESGLDFPCANTIIINRAERLGLAQMHQLRGRVGRAKEQAYAYLLVPGRHLISRDAVKRLQALSELTELGSGFRLAAHDLEIRGAGNILGTSQSGHIATVGYDMYVNMLEKTIKELKGEDIEEEIIPEINLKIPAYIPEGYIKDTNQRLLVYKRLASIRSDEEVQDIRQELNDRYGTIPVFMDNLLEIVVAKNFLKRFSITSIDYYRNKIILSFDSQAEASLDKILELVTNDPNRFRFSPDLKLSIDFHDTHWRSILGEVKNILK